MNRLNLSRHDQIQKKGEAIMMLCFASVFNRHIRLMFALLNTTHKQRIIHVIFSNENANERNKREHKHFWSEKKNSTNDNIVFSYRHDSFLFLSLYFKSRDYFDISRFYLLQHVVFQII